MPMRIAVLVKQVPDTDEVKMDPVRGTMIRDGVGGIVNPLDLHALEAAVSIREDGDSVCVLSMGPPKAEESLRECLALGADRAILATDRAFAGGDSWATSQVIAAMLRKIGTPDLVIAGEKATDGETGQVGPEVAALLGFPVATRVTGLERTDTGLRVRCTLEDGMLTQELPTPCLLTVVSDINTLPLPTLSGKKRAYSQTVERVCASDLSIPAEETGLNASPTRVVEISQPKITRRTEKFLAKRAHELQAGLDRVMDILAESSIL
jgi:electron transfer flavoprotein beta subunit